MKDPTWTYNGKPINSMEEMPENTYGFIYEVVHNPTNKRYIGKKVLYFERNKKLGKRALEAVKEERRAKGLKGRAPIKEKVVSESDWKTYYGSQKEILELVKESKEGEFNREILQFVYSKKQLTYYECKYLFIKEVLESQEKYINNNILGKFYSKDFVND